MSDTHKSAPYGLKTVRQLARSTMQRPGPSPAVAANKVSLKEYFRAKVDPLVSDCVTHLLFEQPKDVVDGLISYITMRKELTKEGSDVNGYLSKPLTATKPRKSHKVFLATQISPVLSYIMGRVARAQPEDVMEFLITELKIMPKVLPPKTKSTVRPQSAMPSQTSPTNKNQFTIDVRPGTAPLTGRPNVSAADDVSANARSPTNVTKTAVEAVQEDSSITFKVGQGIEGRRNSGIKWFAGYIVDEEKDDGVLTGFYTVRYLDGSVETSLPVSSLRAWQAGSENCTEIEVQYQGGIKFYPATCLDVIISDSTVAGQHVRSLIVQYTDGRVEKDVAEERVRSRNTGIGILEVGEKIEARYRRGRKWFKGVIEAISDGACSILYDDGEREDSVVFSMVRSMESQSPVLSDAAVINNLHIGSRIECSMTAEGGALIGWRRGSIKTVHPDNTYDISMDAGDEDYNVPETRLRVPESYPAIEARFKGGKKWFAAIVTCAYADGTFDIDYDDGDSESHVPAKFIRPLVKPGDDFSKPDVSDKLSFDRIGSPIKARYKGGSRWYEGNVSGKNKDGTFNVRYGDGDVEEFIPKRLIKYNKEGEELDISAEESFEDSIGSNDTLPIGVDLTRKYQVDQWVEAQFARKSKFYKGKITKILPGDKYAIDYLDGDKEASVHVRYIRLDPRVIACAGDTARHIIGGIMEKYKPTVKEPEPPRQISILVVGLDGAGKTSFLNALQGDCLAKVRPTVGFKPLTMMLGEKLQVRFYDIGGGKKIRDIWDKYYHDVHACMYVVDSADTSRDEEAIEIFKQTVGNAGLAGKPLCIVCNKQDLDEARNVEDMASLLGVNRNANLHLTPTLTIKEDSRVEGAVEWTINAIENRFAELDRRVNEQVAIRKKEEQAKKLARERKVLRNKVAAAFPFKVGNTDLFPIGITAESDPEDCFSEEEGIGFLSSEIGLTPETLPRQAKNICALVGYQRLALTIIGGLFAPVSKKKEPLSWDDILELVNGVRSELGM